MTAPPDRIWSRPSNVSGVLAFDHPALAASEYLLRDGPTMQAAIAAAEARGGAEAWKAVAALLRSGTPPEMVAAIAEQAVVSLAPAPPPADGGDT